MGVRLNIGCGEHLIPGWLNVDIRPLPDVTVWTFGSRRPPAPWGTVEQILLAYVMIYVPKGDYQQRFAECFRMLRPGGRLTLKEDDNRVRTWRPIGSKHSTGTILSTSNPDEVAPMLRAVGFEVFNEWPVDAEILDTHAHAREKSYVLTGVKP